MDFGHSDSRGLLWLWEKQFRFGDDPWASAAGLLQACRWDLDADFRPAQPGASLRIRRENSLESMDSPGLPIESQ